jgi:hypothetical protein
MKLTESDVLDNILNAFIEDDFETLEDFLKRMGNDEAVLMLHEAIHKYFGG